MSSHLSFTSQSPKIEHVISNSISPENLVFSIRKIKNQKKWTKEEDELLIQLAEKFSEKNWKEISKQFTKKNSLQCFSRYKRIRPGIIKGSWKHDEDIQIIKLVDKYGKAWSKISKTLGTRNGKQIRDRYINVLDPEIKKGKFTEDEDDMLVQLYYKHGSKWATIAKYYNNRTADMVKNRFHSCIKKRLGLEKEIKCFEKGKEDKKGSDVSLLEQTAASLSVKSSCIDLNKNGNGNSNSNKGKDLFVKDDNCYCNKYNNDNNNKYCDSNYNDNCEDNININNINQQRFMFDDNDFDFLKIMDTNGDNNGNMQSNNYQQDEFHLYFDDYFKW